MARQYKVNHKVMKALDDGKCFTIESETNKGKFYKISMVNDTVTCSCPFNVHRKIVCKHIEELVQQDEYKDDEEDDVEEDDVEEDDEEDDNSCSDSDSSSSGCSDSSCNDRYKDYLCEKCSYNDGYNNGDDAGYSAGLDDGYADGLDDGYADGHEDGFVDGYDKGHSVGWNRAMKFIRSRKLNKE